MSANCSMGSLSNGERERRPSQAELSSMRVNALPQRSRKSEKTHRTLSKWSDNRATMGSSPELSSPTHDKADQFDVFSRISSHAIVDQRQRLRHDIAQYLARDHIEILEAIIAGNFTTEGLAQLAPCILDLVKMHASPASTLQFVQNVLGHKISVYYGDTPNPPDMTSLKNVLRDNSLPALLLSTYVRSELLPFMIESMRPIISSNMALLSDCESDTTHGSAPSTGNQDENLRQVTVAVISALLQSTPLVPMHIRRLLTFLHAKIESSIALLRKTHRLSSPTVPPSPTSTAAAALPLPRSRESSSRSVVQSSPQSTESRTHSTEPDCSPKLASVKPGRPSRSSSTSPQRPSQPPTPLIISPDTPPVLPPQVFGMSPLVEGSFSGSFSYQAAYTEPSHQDPASSRNPSPPLAKPVAAASKVAGHGWSHLLSINTSLVHGGPAAINSPPPHVAAGHWDAGSPPSPHATPSSADSSDASGSPNASDDGAAMRRRALKRTNAVNRRSHQLQYTLADQVVATFLFLRVLVPTLTLPDQSGLLVPGTSTRDIQRGLILMGKILMSVVNDSDSKPGSVSGAQLQFLQEQRKRVKLFVGSLLTPADGDSEASSPVTSVPADMEPTRAPFMPKSSPRSSLPSAPAQDPHDSSSSITLPPRPKTADPGTYSTHKSRHASSSSGTGTSTQATDTTAARGTVSRKTPTLRSLFRVGGGATLRKRNDYRSMPSLMSPVDGSLGGALAGGSSGDVASKPAAKKSSGENSVSSVATDSHTNVPPPPPPRVPEVPTDLFISQLNKGMDKVEMWVLSSVEAEEVPPSLVITLLQLRPLVQQFLALPKPGSAGGGDASDDEDEHGNTSPLSAKSTGGTSGGSGTGSGSGGGVSFLKNLGRKLLNKNQRSLEFTGSNMSGGASTSTSTGTFSEFVQSPTSSSRASSEHGISAKAGGPGEGKSRSHNASTDMHPASVDASLDQQQGLGGQQPRRRSRFLPRPLSVPGGLLLSMGDGNGSIGGGGGTGGGQTPS